MSEQITINIEIKPHFKKYLIANYGQEPIKFPYKHNYNRFIVLNLIKPPKDFKLLQNNECSVSIVLPKNNLHDITSYNYLSERDKIIFREEIEQDFWRDVKEYINKQQREEKLNLKKAVILLMKMYNISENELTFDAIYKHFQREKKKRSLMFTFSIF